MPQIGKNDHFSAPHPDTSEGDQAGYSKPAVTPATYVPPHRRTANVHEPAKDAIEPRTKPSAESVLAKEGLKKLSLPYGSREEISKISQNTSGHQQEGIASKSQARYIPPHQRSASSTSEVATTRPTLPPTPAPKTPALESEKSASNSNQILRNRSIKDSSPGPSTQRTASLESTRRGKISNPAVQPVSSKVIKGASGLSASFLNLSLTNTRYILGEIRHAPLKSLVPENAYMSDDNALAHWEGTPAINGRPGISAHCDEFKNVLTNEGRRVATDPVSYASFAREVALKPLNNETGKRVMEYTYRNRMNIRIAKYDESTNILVRVDIKSAIITVYRMFPVDQKKMGALPPILGLSKEGMDLFLKTHQLETQIGVRESVQ